MKAAALTEVKESFKIFVGENNTNKIYTGFPDKGNATLRNGTQLGEIEHSGGEIQFPNFWEGWGRRVINGKVSKDGMVAVNDPAYRGEIEFLDIDNPEGYLIHCRWMPSQSSLDYDYQTLRLNLPTKDKDSDDLFFSLERGEHKIDPNKGRSYALAMKVHPMNANSRYKTKRYTSTLFKEVLHYETNKSNIKALDIDFEAKSYVKECSTSFSKLKVLHTVLSESGEIKYDASDENSLYDSLMLFANEKPEEAVRLVKKYKADTSNVIEICKSHNQFDTSKNGVLSVGGMKKEVLLSDIDGNYKGEDMIQYIFDKCFEPKVNEAINKLHELSKILNK